MSGKVEVVEMLNSQAPTIKEIVDLRNWATISIATIEAQLKPAAMLPGAAEFVKQASALADPLRMVVRLCDIHIANLSKSS